MNESKKQLAAQTLKHRGETPGGVLNFELGTDVRPEVSITTL